MNSKELLLEIRNAFPTKLPLKDSQEDKDACQKVIKALKGSHFNQEIPIIHIQHIEPSRTTMLSDLSFLNNRKKSTEFNFISYDRKMGRLV